ncbi:MAG: cell division protein ZapA [Sphingomonadales bacterium]|nr:cell division protein ZapA [Sphingomonadales bacterium]
MSNVKLAIGGRDFTVACAEGEEDHVIGLGEMIASKITAMGDLSSQSETRMLLFAALLLADELHDATMRSGSHQGAAAIPALPNGSAKRLDAIAERLENLASRLEG